MEHPALTYREPPIAKLPYELLVVVFRFGTEQEFSNSLTEPPNFSRHPVPFARRVSQVCRIWREISRNFPTLWATMPYYEFYNARWIDEFLELSHNSPLDIKLSAGLKSRHTPPSNISALYDHFHRVRTLYGTTHSSTPPSDFQTLLGSTMPNLQTLVLRYGFGVWDLGNSSVATFPEFLLGGAPSLTTFISFRCYADLSSPVFSQLRALEIHDIPPPFCLTVSEWLDSLRNIPSLQKLSLTQSIILDSFETVIDMPCLRILRFSGDFTIFGLLGRLLTPRLEQLDLSLTCGCPSNVFVLEEMVKRAFCRSLQHWGEWLVERTLGLRLTDDRLVIHTLCSPPSRPTKKHTQRLLVELKWTLNNTIPRDVDVIVDSIGESVQPIRSLATRIDISLGEILGTGANPSSLSPIPSHLSVSLRRLFGNLSHVRRWMGYSIKDVSALSSLLLGKTHSEANGSLVFPLLDAFSLLVGPSIWQARLIQAFIDGRNWLGKPIQTFRVSAGDRLNLGDRDFGCRIEEDDQSLEVFIEQDETKHISTELESCFL